MDSRPCTATGPLPLPREAERPSPPQPKNPQATPLICRLPLKRGVVYGAGGHDWIPACQE